MSTSILPTRSSSSLTRLRHTLTTPDPFTLTHSLTRTQYRGKKKLPTSTTIPIRLLKNIARYGRAGSLVAVSPGTMRNSFFPKGLAAYLSAAEQRTLGDSVGERDYTYGLKAAQLAAKEETRSKILDSAIYSAPAGMGVSPVRALELLRKFVPPVIEYFRVPVQTAVGEGTGMGGAEVVGPVTTREIAETIRNKLLDGASAQGDAQAAKVMVGPRDIHIKGGVDALGRTAEEAGDAVDRINKLGSFSVVITVRGGGEMLTKVRVLTQGAPPQVIANPMTDGPRASV